MTKIEADPTVDDVITAPIAVIGAGPAGLMLTHLLARVGVEAIAVNVRTRDQIQATQWAGLLEADAARRLVETGVSDRILTEGREHEGFERFGGRAHRIDVKALTGQSTWVYPQTEVFRDLADARVRDGGTVHFGVRDTQVLDVETAAPRVQYTAADGARQEIRARFVVGADGARGICRGLVPEVRRVQYYKVWPFAWYGILVEAPISAQELVYAHSSQGFALISQRTPHLQRMYFQCAAEDSTDSWTDDRIWATLEARVRGDDGFSLRDGPILARKTFPFHSFVQEPLRWGSLILLGDAAHTLPPTGSRGLNLALHEAHILADVLPRALNTRDESTLEDYPRRAMERVWRAQHFSYWMTQVLHLAPASSAFDVRRQIGARHRRQPLAPGSRTWPSSTPVGPRSPERDEHAPRAFSTLLTR